MSGGIDYLDALIGAMIVQDEGSPLTKTGTMNFVGAGVTAVYSSVNNRIDVTIPSGTTATGWTDTSNIVHLTVGSDTVAIGAAAMASTEKVRILGETRIEGQLGVIGGTIYSSPDSASYVAAGEGVGSIVCISTSTTSVTEGFIGYNHSNSTVAPRLQFSKSRGTRAAKTIVTTGDSIGRVRWFGYDGAAYQEGARIEAVANGTIAAGSVPTNVIIATGASFATLVPRATFASNGSQTHNTDAGATYKWQINSSATPLFYSGDVLYIGTTVTNGEPAGSIVAIANDGGGGTQPGGLVAWCHGSTVAEVAVAKTGGTRSAPTALNGTEAIGSVTSWGYDGTAMRSGGVIFFQCDGAPVAGTSLPTKFIIATGSTGNGVVRSTWGSTGAQTHNCDTGSGYTWNVNSVGILSSSAVALTVQSTVLFLQVNSEANTNASQYLLRKDRGGGTTAAANGDFVGRILYQSHDGTTYRTGAEIRATLDAAVSASVNPTAIAVMTTATTGVTARTTWASSGAQTHDMNAGATYTHKINGANQLVYDGTNFNIQAQNLVTTGILNTGGSTALGGGAAPTFGTIGGTGPTTAAQSKWLKVQIAGTNHWLPAWT